MAVALASFDPELQATWAQLQASPAFRQQVTAFLAQGSDVLPAPTVLDSALTRVCMEVQVLACCCNMRIP